MFEDVAWIILALVAITAFNAYREGRLGDWLRAKFLNAAQPSLPLTGMPAPTTSSTEPAGLLTSIVQGVLGRPVTGVDDPTDPDQLFGTSRGRAHNGVDWPVPTGTPVRASTGGRVTHAGAAGDYGFAVYVDHGNGLETRYAHLSRVSVRAGDVVNAGQVVGESGSTGRSTGPHLHFEVRQDGRPVDPLGHINASGGVVA
jgi:murein DD-endopeptidase MepM/ murein hydrolase activator NlpD